MISFDKLLRMASTMPPQLKLFGEFIRQGELVNLFAPTSYGKSALAYNLAIAIANGDAEVCGEVNELARPMSTLYIDGELSPQQIYARYSKLDAPPQLFFESLDSLQLKHGSDFRLTADFIGTLIEEIDARFLIIDNLGSVLEDPQNPTNSAKFVFELKLLCRKYNCTILLISHSTKGGIQLKPIPVSISQSEGSYKISSYCDHVVGMNKASDGTLYLRHLKARSGQSDSILKLIDINTDAGYLQAIPSGYALIDELFSSASNDTTERNTIDYENLISDILLNSGGKMSWYHNDLVRAVQTVLPDVSDRSGKHYIQVMLKKNLLYKDNSKYLIVCQTETIPGSDPKAFGLIPNEIDVF